MDFTKEKKAFLSKKDKSTKKSIDKGILRLVSMINYSSDYYTTSSCSGRITIIRRADERKDRCVWLFRKHSTASFNEIKDVLKSIPNGLIWLKFEPLIMHVRCKNIEAASKLIGAAHKAGMKRTGAIALKSKITVEIGNTEHIEALVAADKKLLADDACLKKLLQEANRKLKRNNKRIKKLCESLSLPDSTDY